MVTLDDVAITQALESLPGWSYKDDSLQRRYLFPNFESAMAFMVECTPAISAADHHPDWNNVNDRVDVMYRTHDAGNKVTQKDVTMARKFEAIYQNGYASRL